jgi:hypothetical protein
MRILSLHDCKLFPVKDRWCIHSYYTVCPYAPDGSGRILAAAGDLNSSRGEVIVLSSDGEVLDRFGSIFLHNGFYHTGNWQTWSPDGRYVFYRGGTLEKPRMLKRELVTGLEWEMNGNTEGTPPFGEPILSGLTGMLYAAGYGDGVYQPELAPVPFRERDRHGLFRYSFSATTSELALSVSDMLARHPQRDILLKLDREQSMKPESNGEGLTLLCYCVRWSPDGSRLLFYFGNHNAYLSRGEYRLSYVMTADPDLKDIRLAVDLSQGRRGLHWSWQPDGERLIGYGPDPEEPKRMCLAEVRFDGSGYRKLSHHASGGHPSVSPVNPFLAVTDDGLNPGHVLFIDLRNDTIIAQAELPRVVGEKEQPGRNPLRVCHHPVFSRDGSKVLINTLPGRHAVLAELGVTDAIGSHFSNHL